MENLYTRIVVKLLPLIGKTFITPNIITSLNILNTFVIFWCVWNEKYLIASLLIQLLLFLDIVDGNLARYKGMCSKLGKILDRINDSIFYYIFYIIFGIKIGINPIWIALYIAIYLSYSLITTFYIVPQIRKMPNFIRRGIKKSFMDRGILLGMDISSQCLITSILLITPYKEYILYSISFLYAFDLVYRLYELNFNKRAKDKQLLV